MWKRALKWIGIVLAVVVVGVGGFVFAQASAFDASIEKHYDVSAAIAGLDGSRR